MSTEDNILLIRLKSIGDILFTLPAVHVVRENFPGARLHFLVSQENAPLLRGFSEIDAVIPLDRAVYFSKNPKAICGSTFQLLRRLRQQHFSRAIDLQGYGETELLAWWSGAPTRWGCVYNRSRGWLYTRGVRRNEKIHPADWNLSLLEQCGLHPGKIVNEFVLPEDALNEARRFFAAHNLKTDKPTLFIQPFTSSPQKNWPLENFLELAQHWQQHGLQVLFGGGPADWSALEPVRQAGFPISAGVPLLVTGGLTRLSTLALGGDTGVLHLAVALGKRVVMIMESAAPSRPHPYQHADWALVPPNDRIISNVKTATVLQACVRAFNEAGLPLALWSDKSIAKGAR
ncbi:MAG: glycosyltransferase family 9 protein [Verrucomicrobiota bacterium]|jgi:ADP-heptose:LPS heptosyltransferase